jgi:hypothetical protein
MSEIVVVDAYQPMHVYWLNFLQHAAWLFSNDDPMDGSLWEYHPQLDPVTNERVYVEMNTGDFGSWVLSMFHIAPKTMIPMKGVATFFLPSIFSSMPRLLTGLVASRLKLSFLPLEIFALESVKMHLLGTFLVFSSLPQVLY